MICRVGVCSLRDVVALEVVAAGPASVLLFSLRCSASEFERRRRRVAARRTDLPRRQTDLRYRSCFRPFQPRRHHRHQEGAGRLRREVQRRPRDRHHRQETPAIGPEAEPEHHPQDHRHSRPVEHGRAAAAGQAHRVVHQLQAEGRSVPDRRRISHRRAFHWRNRTMTDSSSLPTVGLKGFFAT